MRIQDNRFRKPNNRRGNRNRSKNYCGNKKQNSGYQRYRGMKNNPKNGNKRINNRLRGVLSKDRSFKSVVGQNYYNTGLDCGANNQYIWDDISRTYKTINTFPVET